ncbi:4-hydroxythreonine-4-phosphate dehydrogenase PdxA, partial [Telmatospirillum sp.]|uniref:4-hydroxythreonine-4-phosphate dehydrogenase PdxA n=1 Tax=Telmatospirillum sp. TaxID=2079197 RepID=UPI00284254D0
CPLAPTAWPVKSSYLGASLPSAAVAKKRRISCLKSPADLSKISRRAIGGTCGREEIDIIAPAVAEMRAEGYPIDGPFPADTIFLKARDGHYDAIVTMYHDQGQIAIKLLGFEKGVTIQGGLPVPITTPAHGTAFDIAGQNKANVEAMAQAFFIACRMGAAHRANRSSVLTHSDDVPPHVTPSPSRGGA